MKETIFGYCTRVGDGTLLREWHPKRNGALTPRDVSRGSHQKIWWRCANDHEWEAAAYSRAAGSGCPYCAGKRIQPGENDLATLYPALLAEWHPTKNAGIAPEAVSPWSHRKVWWMCERGHEWAAAINSRAQGCGCPVCANRKIRRGENDLATTHPALAREWDFPKNGALVPERISAGSDRRVWWRCEKGHEWRAAINRRAGAVQSGCPVCAGRVVLPGFNDLATAFPQIAAEWDAAKNAPLRADQVAPYANRKVWWRCEQGHSYQALVDSRTTAGSGCPYCAGRRVLPGFNDLATLEPKLAAEWHPTLNGTLTPEMVTCGAHKAVWWVCGSGHVWQAQIYSRAGKGKCGCPVCAGRYRHRSRVPARAGVAGV